MVLLLQIQNDLKLARMAKDNDKVQLYQMLLSKIQNETIRLKRGLGEDEIIAIIKKEIKDYKELENAQKSLILTEDTPENKAKLLETVEKIKILQSYLPRQLSKDEIRDVLISKGAKKGMHMGKLIGMIMSTHKSVVDGKVVHELIQEEFLD